MTIQTTLRPSFSHEISVSTTAAENTVPLKTNDLGIFCDTACYIKLGMDDTVTATTTAGTGYDKFIPAGVEYEIRTGGAKYISVILASGSDTAYLTEYSKDAL